MCLHPKEHLPTEMWAEIFLYVKSPQDLYNLTEAHPFWAAMLEPQLPHIHFQLAFPLLANLLAERTDNRSSVLAGTPYLSQNDLLNCRLVCKSWDEAVRTYYEDSICSDSEAPFIDERNLTGNHFCGMSFDTLQLTRRDISFCPDESPYPHDMEDFDPRYYRSWLESILISHPPQTEANPFFSRKWVSKIHLSGPPIENYVDIRATLQAYGRHLRSFTLFTQSTIPLEMFYLAPKEWLTFTPNLIYLKVLVREYIFEDITLSPEEMAAFENYIHSHPLPELRQLEVLRLESLAPPVQNELLQRYHHVKGLRLDPSNVWNWQPEVIQSAPFENLKALLLEIRDEGDMLSLGRCHHPSWLQLEVLVVDFRKELRQPRARIDDYLTLIPVEPFTPSWEQIVTWLNQHFGQANKLEKVLLCLPRYEPSQEAAVLRETQQCRLQLRTVQQLKLRLMNPTILVDFLLPMKDSLQKVAIEFMCQEVNAGDFPLNASVDLPEKVLWNGYLGKNLLESNLWGIFPKLNFLRVESYKGWTYRRKLGNLPAFINPDGTEERMNKDNFEDEGQKWTRGLNLRTLFDPSCDQQD